MAYSQRIKDLIRTAPRTAGNTLGRWAVHLEFPVTKLAYALGVTRQTIYNWFAGGEVFVAYQQRVDLMVSVMSTSKTAEEAWRRICKVYNLKP
jgi:hypothetical protein